MKIENIMGYHVGNWTVFDILYILGGMILFSIALGWFFVTMENHVRI